MRRELMPCRLEVTTVRRECPEPSAARESLTPERAQQLVTDFEQVTIRELAIDILRAVHLGLELSIYAYDA